MLNILQAVKNVVRESMALTYSGSRIIRDPDGPAKSMMPAITEDVSFRYACIQNNEFCHKGE